MPDDRMESVSTQSRILLSCGIVLGLCLGFVAGHVAVWSRVATSVQSEQNPFLAESIPAYPDAKATATQPAPHVSAPGPFFAAGAKRLPSPTPTDRVRVATDTTPSEFEPKALFHETATPIDEETQLREDVTRTIIAQELPHATEQELEVWFDVLHGMEAADVKGILRMRKHVGGDPGSAFGMLRANPDVTTPAPPRKLATDPGTSHDKWGTTLDGLKQIRDIHLHNLANTQTIGFIRQIPVTRELNNREGQVGAQFLNAELDDSPGLPFHTGRSFDVAIEGNGFFQVRQGDEVRLTRNGRLRLDESHHLVLSMTSDPWRLDPPIKVPERATSVVFHPNGQVSGTIADSSDEIEIGTIRLVNVDNPSHLEPVGEVLYVTTELSGPSHEQTSGGQLRGRSVERMSTHVIEAEMHALDRVTLLIDQMTDDRTDCAY